MTATDAQVSAAAPMLHKAGGLDPKKLHNVLDHMRDIQTEGDRWELAESLVVMIPKGSTGFNDVIDAATQEGVVGNLSANTLRLYRDTAVRWPQDKRVKNVSFSAHREAMVMPSIDAAVKMLNDLVKTQGANKVTVAAVRKAVAINQGKQPKAQTTNAPKSAPAGFDIVRDLRDNGGQGVIAAIGTGTDAATLDRLNESLAKVIAHVERLRAKQARAKAQAKGAAAKMPAKSEPAQAGTVKPAAKKAVGDIRGL